MALAQYPHPWFLSKAKAIMNLNIQRSQGVGGGGFLLLLLRSERDLKPTSKHNFPHFGSWHNITLLFSRRDI
jgi:hypothetical protein